MSNLLVRAEADIKIAKLLISPIGNPTNDEMVTDQAAYHTQQAIEKAIELYEELKTSILKKIEEDTKSQA